MKRHLAWLASFGTVGLLIASCGGTSTGGGGLDGGGATTVNQGIAQLSDAICAKAFSCIPVLAPITFDGTVADCKIAMSKKIQSPYDTGNWGLTVDSLTACTNALKTAGCEFFFAHELPSVCIVPGKVANGGPCVQDEECAGRLCDGVSDTACGTCKDVPGEGNACTKQCANGLSCVSQKCIKLGTTGATCATSGECQGNLTCFQTQCTRPAAEGGACDLQGKKAPTCSGLDGLFCNPLQGKCEKVGQATTGQACGVLGTAPNLTYSICDGKSYCNTTGGSAQSGTCIAKVGDGSACTKDSECLYPYTCHGGKCAIAPSLTCK